jgi:hypothetical protein
VTSLRRFTLAALTLALSATATGCSDDCTRLADEVCVRVGEASDECKRIRERAESASQDDKRACGKALAVTHLLTPKS